MGQSTLDKHRKSLSTVAERKVEMWATSRNQQKKMGNSVGARK